MATFPFVTNYDVLEKSDGSIDPLGIYTLSERIAQQMVKGVRERQKYPRFITLIALSKLFEVYLEDKLDEIRVIEPWQAFEWIIVQSFTHWDMARGDDKKGLSGLPGNLKAKRVLLQNENFTPSSYLSVPSVFGFHGIYRVLVKDLGLMTDEGLNEVGHTLLESWVHDQKIKGFLHGTTGLAKQRDQILKIMASSCMQGRACMKSKHYSSFEFLYDFLHHREIGKSESEELWKMLATDPESHRDEILEFMVSKEGQKAYERGVSKGGERVFHKALHKVASDGLKTYLDAIFEYEYFSRLLDDAFSHSMREMSSGTHSLSVQELSDLKSFEVAADNLKVQYQRTYEALMPLKMELDFANTFEDICNFESRKDLVVGLMKHHTDIQKAKGQKGVGKAPWVFEGKNGYSRHKIFKKEFKPTLDKQYVNFYRSNSLRQFAVDLRKIKEAA